MKQRFLLLIVIALSLTLFPLNASGSTPKLNTACKSNNQIVSASGIQFKCAVSNRILIWTPIPKSIHAILNAKCPSIINGYLTTGVGPNGFTWLKCSKVNNRNIWLLPNQDNQVVDRNAVTTPLSNSNLSSKINSSNFNLVTGSSGQHLDTIAGSIDVNSADLPIVSVEVALAGLDGGPSLNSWNAKITLGNEYTGTWNWNFVIPETVPIGKYRFVVTAQKSNTTFAELVSISFEVVNGSSNHQFSLIPETCSNENCPQSVANEISVDMGKCKISDATALNGMTEGFPRPQGALIKQSSYKVLVIPVSFSDLPYTPSELAFTKQRFEATNNEFQLFSYGSSTLEPTYADPASWPFFSSTLKDFASANGNDETRITRAILEKVQQIPLKGYDAIWITSARDSTFSYGAEQPFVSYATGSGTIEHIFTVLGGDGKPIDHGLGHILFYFDDEYQSPGWIDQWSSRGEPLVGFDIYGRGNELLGWNRWLVGWISDQQVYCLPSFSGEGTYRLSYLNAKDGEMKMIVVPTGPNTAVIAEYKNNQAMNAAGLLVYKVDLTIPQWQIRFRGNNRILGLEESSTIDNLKFSVIGADSGGIYVKLQRTG